MVRVSRDVRKTMRNATMVPFACFGAAASATASAQRNKMSLKKEDRQRKRQ